MSRSDLRPGTSVARYMETIECGIYIGVIRELKGDPDPVKTLKRQRQRIYTMVYRRQIPCIKKDGHLRFDRNAIDDWLRTGAQHTWTHTPSAPTTHPISTRPLKPGAQAARLSPSALWRDPSRRDQK